MQTTSTRLLTVIACMALVTHAQSHSDSGSISNLSERPPSTQKRAIASHKEKSSSVLGAPHVRQKIVYGSKYRMGPGQGYTICEALFKKMNTAPMPVCAYDLLMKLPGVSQPGWRELNLHEHKALYKRFALATRIRPDDWNQVFSDQPPEPGTQLTLRTMPSDQQLDEDWAEAIKANSKFFIVDKPPQRMEDDGLLLIVFHPSLDSKGKKCPHITALGFDGGLKAPVHEISPSGNTNIPFKYNNKLYSSMDSIQFATTFSISIYDAYDPVIGWRATEKWNLLGRDLICGMGLRPELFKQVNGNK